MTAALALPSELSAVLSGASRWCVLHGKCEELLPLMPAKSVHHFICDPPYSKHVHEKSRAGARVVPLKDGNGKLSRSALSRTRDFGFDHLSADLRRTCAREYARIASRWTLVFSDVESASWWRISLAAQRLDYVRTVAWIKLGCAPQFTGDRPAAAFEAITLAHPKGKKRWNAGGKRGVYSVPIELDRYGHGRVHREHPAQKPLALMLELIEDFTDPGDIIVDSFCGFATTGVACVRLGRRFIGIEKDPQHAANSHARLEAETHLTTLSALRTGQETLF